MGGTTGCEAGVPPAGKDGTGHVKKSYRKLIIREVTHSLSRFLAIFGIVALGVGFLAGLLATTPDMRVSVDRYYDETRMFDIRVVSTLGLTEADAAAIRNTGGVKGVMPSRTADALVRIPQGDDLVARIQSLPLALLQEDSPGYQNRVSLLEGRMPAGPGECVLDVSKIADQGVEVGDVLTLSPDNADLSDTLALSAFTVVGKVESATYFSIEREPSTVGNGTVSLIFYTGDDAFSLDVYTDLYILVDGADAQTAFTDGYEDAVRPVMDTLETLGIDLDDEAMRKVTERIIELGDKKQAVTSEDLPYIIADVLKQDVYETQVHILNYNLSLSQGLRPVATLKIRINDEEYEQTSSGDGQYDAFMRALRKIYKEQLRREFPMLVNYTVSIPPGGRTDAFVQTYITWEYRGDTFKTRGLDADQTEAAIKATLKMLNKLENMQA